MDGPQLAFRLLEVLDCTYTNRRRAHGIPVLAGHARAGRRLRRLGCPPPMKRHKTRYPGAKRTSKLGYVLVYQPDHHLADANGEIYEHRLIAESLLGRRLLPGEVVHHVNKIKHDNRPENLQVFSTHGEHRIHESGDRCRNGHPRDDGNVVTRYSKGKPYRGCRSCERAKNWKRFERNGGRWRA